jgi:hypothetical protein
MFRRRVFTHHHVGDSRLDPVYGWQFVLPNGLESNCQLNTGSELPCGNATVDENPSAKGCPPKNGSFAGANGLFAGANSLFAGANGLFAGANGLFAGANGLFADANSLFAGANSSFAWENGSFSGGLFAVHYEFTVNYSLFTNN